MASQPPASPTFSSSESESEFEEFIPPKLAPAQAAATCAARASKCGTSSQAQVLSDGELEDVANELETQTHFAQELPPSILDHKKMERLLRRSIIYVDDLENPRGRPHPLEPPEWLLWHYMWRFGRVAQVTSVGMCHPVGHSRICLIVFKHSAAARRARAAFPRPWDLSQDIYGAFSPLKPDYLPLIRYAMLLSDILQDMPETLKMEAGYGIVPRFYTDTSTSCGYLAARFSLSQKVAPKMRTRTFYALLDPRTFTELPGIAPSSEAHEGSRFTLPPSPFDPDNGDVSHLQSPYRLWHGDEERLRMIRGIVDSLVDVDARAKPSEGQKQKSPNAEDKTNDPVISFREPLIPKPTSFDPGSFVILTVQTKEQFASSSRRFSASVRSTSKIWNLMKGYGPVQYVVGSELHNATHRKYYVSFQHHRNAVEAHQKWQPTPHCLLEYPGTLPSEFGSWLARLWESIPHLVYRLPKDFRYLQLFVPSSTGGMESSQTVTLNQPGISEPDQFPAPIPSILVESSTLDDATSPANPLATSVRQGHILNNLLYPEDCSDPIEADMLTASHVLMQMEGDLINASLHSGILKLVSQVSDGYIPDDDLYNLRRRARKLLATIGVQASAPDASGSSCPLPGNEVKAEPNIPTVKIEPLDDPISLNVKRSRDEDGDGSEEAGPGLEEDETPKGCRRSLLDYIP